MGAKKKLEEEMFLEPQHNAEMQVLEVGFWEENNAERLP
jgi:hypothetical protein